MKKIILANALAKVWFYLILLIGFLLLLAQYGNDTSNGGAMRLLSNILLGVLFYKLIQLLFKPLKMNQQLYNDYLNENNINKYLKNRTWVMICTILITVIFILPTFGLILSLTITQFISLSKQKNIIT